MNKPELHNADCFPILKTLPDKSIDAVITDPPYNLGLAHWDKLNPGDIDTFFEESKRIELRRLIKSCFE